MKLPNCLVIAGEKSGEEHAMSFLKKVKERNPNVEFWGVGGDELERMGVKLEFHLRDFSSWGFTEVFGKIPFYIKAMKTLEKKVLQRETKVAILIDFQTFNLKLAKRLKKHGVKVLYYVAPQAWAWKEYRAGIIEDTVHTLFTIIPFEKKWFEDRGVRKVMSVNHPLYLTYGSRVESLKQKNQRKTFTDIQACLNILILPGSRNFEVGNLLEPFLTTALKLKKERRASIALVRSSNVKKDYYKPFLDYFDDVFENDKLDIALEWGHVALAASGTVTLTCALFEVPAIVSYKSSLFNEWVFRTFINYKNYFSLANIVHEKEVFPELIQDEVSVYNIEVKLKRLIENREYYEKIKKELENTGRLLSKDSSKVSEYISEVIEENYER